MSSLLIFFSVNFSLLPVTEVSPLQVLYSVTYYVFPSLTGEHGMVLSHT